VKLISKQIEVFSARREYDSVHYSDACKAVELGQFKDVNLGSDNGKQPEIAKGQFYQALADAMTTRLLPESARELIRAVEALNVSALPDDISPKYGETEVRHLCAKFGLSFRDVKLAYRQHRDSHSASSSTNIKTLLNCVSTIPMSTATCERGFSKMNVICSSLRSRLTVSHISSLMFISLCGPPLHIWQPVTYVKLECGPMPNVMAALPNIGGALCSTPQSLADAHY